MNGFMAKVTEFKTLKKRQARRRGLGLLALTALVLVGAYLLSALVNTPNFAGLSSVLDMIQGGPGYPIDAPGGKVKGMYQNGSSLVVVNETTIYFYNTSGSEVYSAQHRMGNPQVATNGTMLLNFDRGSKTYTAYSRNNQFYTGTTETAIRCGDISANGCIAIATQSENAHSQVQVMDNKQRLQHTWSSDDVVTAMAISDNGSMVAIGSSYVEEGELKNSLTVLRGGEELFLEELPFVQLYFRTYSVVYSAELVPSTNIRYTELYNSIERWYFVEESTDWPDLGISGVPALPAPDLSSLTASPEPEPQE